MLRFIIINTCNTHFKRISQTPSTLKKLRTLKVVLIFYMFLGLFGGSQKNEMSTVQEATFDYHPYKLHRLVNNIFIISIKKMSQKLFKRDLITRDTGKKFKLHYLPYSGNLWGTQINLNRIIIILIFNKL